MVKDNYVNFSYLASNVSKSESPSKYALTTHLYYRTTNCPKTFNKDNLVPRVLSYPPYGAREKETARDVSLSLSRSVGRVGENPGNEVVIRKDKAFKNAVETESTRTLSNFNFQWTKTLYQNNLKHIAFFFTFFKG